jgi:hypothetical protein
MKKKLKKLLETLFLIRDLRTKKENFKRVSRSTYKTLAGECSEAGIPIRTGVEYRHGRAVKMLTILQVDEGGQHATE